MGDKMGDKMGEKIVHCYSLKSVKRTILVLYSPTIKDYKSLFFLIFKDIKSMYYVIHNDPNLLHQTNVYEKKLADFDRDAGPVLCSTAIKVSNNV